MPKHRKSRRNIVSFLAPFTAMLLVSLVGLVGMIFTGRETTGADGLILPQFETRKGAPFTSFLRQERVDKIFWHEAFSMSGAPLPGPQSVFETRKQQSLARLMRKMRHDIETHGLISRAEENEEIKSLELEAQNEAMRAPYGAIYPRRQ